MQKVITFTTHLTSMSSQENYHEQDSSGINKYLINNRDAKIVSVASSVENGYIHITYIIEE